MKVIITGATGMVGKGVLLECLDDSKISEVLVVGRNSINMEHPKLKEAVATDMSKLDSIADQLKGYDITFFCLGISAIGLSEEDYRRITYDLTLNFARVFLEQNPDASFIYVSGQGTASSEKGSMWARVKGKTENDLLKMPFKRAYMYRPGMIYPERGIKSRTALYNRLMPILKVLFPILNTLTPNSVTTTARIGKSMIAIADQDYGKQHIVAKDINQLARS